MSRVRHRTKGRGSEERVARARAGGWMIDSVSKAPPTASQDNRHAGCRCRIRCADQARRLSSADTNAPGCRARCAGHANRAEIVDRPSSVVLVFSQHECRTASFRQHVVFVVSRYGTHKLADACRTPHARIIAARNSGSITRPVIGTRSRCRRHGLRGDASSIAQGSPRDRPMGGA